MLNIIKKKIPFHFVNRLRQLHSIYNKRSDVEWELQQLFNQHQKQVKKSEQSPKSPNSNSTTDSLESFTKFKFNNKKSQLNTSDPFAVDYYQGTDQPEQNHKQKKNSKPKNNILNQKKLDEQFMQNFYQDALDVKINKFSRITSLGAKMRNSQQLVLTLSSLLKRSQQMKIVNAINKFINSEGYVQGSLPAKPSKQQKELFKKVHTILLQSLQDPGSVRQLIKKLSESNPHFIKINQNSKCNQLQSSATSFEVNKRSKHEVIDQSNMDAHNNLFANNTQSTSLQILNQLSNMFISVDEATQTRNQTLNLIKQLQQQQQKVSLKNKMPKLNKIKLLLKKQPSRSIEFKTDQATVQKVQKKIFGNKKMLTQNIVFKRVQNKINEKYNSFGENWVYAYDLPYELDQQVARNIIESISKKYGTITQYIAESYQNFVEKTKNAKVVILPQNYNEQTKKNKIVGQKRYLDNIQQILRQHQQLKQGRKAVKPSLVSRILEKKNKQKNTALNKSTIVFKFLNKQDKIRFLSPQMRLFGLNLPNLHNIKFQQAQSKNVVTLNMVPWACQSSQLLKFINDSLNSLKISVTHPNCIIANGYIFAEMANFYEALYAKDLLNNLIFQNQRLKCQLSYGSSYVHQGKYRYNNQFNHYDQLSNKLKDLRDKFNQIYQ